LIDHVAGETGRLHRLRPRGREVPDLDGLPPFPLRATFDFSPRLDRPRLQPRRLAIEHEDRFDSRLHEIREAVNESGEMRCDPTLAVHEGRAVRLPDDREELVEGVERIDRQDFSREVLQLARFQCGQMPERLMPIWRPIPAGV